MYRILVAIALLLPFIATGCSAWRANNASQTVDFNPSAIGSGESVFTPSAIGNDDYRSRR